MQIISPKLDSIGKDLAEFQGHANSLFVISPAIRDICMANFIETLIVTFFGVEALPEFLNLCFL